MKICDRIYGKFEIDSPLLIALLQSDPLKRLKDISQFGVPDEFYHLKGYSRFEHSLGVMLFLKLLNASFEEQIAGLLHDVSHTAFSHVYDWLLDRGEIEDYQDKNHLKQITGSKIGEILKSSGFDPKRIANFHNFSLLDSPIPYLCADRIDYALREFPPKIAKICLQNFTVLSGKIYCKNRSSARSFAFNFLKCHRIHWGGFEAVNRYYLFAEALKIALLDKIIHKSDFAGTESVILNKLERSKNKKIRQILFFLQRKSLADLPKSSKILHKKFRFVDPKIVNRNGKRLSEVDSEFKKLLDEAKKENEKGVRVVGL